MRKYFFSYVFIFVSLFFIQSLRAEDGVTDSSIVFGQAAALDGPASALGKGMNVGILAAFKEINDKGGINGRKLELKSLDDGYEPEKAIEQTKILLEQEKVFALIGGVGTPTSNAVVPIITEAKVPYIAPFTGAELLRSPFNRYVVNLRSSYWQETEEWVERLTTDLGIKKIAILFQDDTYGRAGLTGVEKALEKRGMKLVGSGTYMRNTIAVKSAVLEIRKSDPEAVVMVGAYKPCAEFIRVYKKLGYTGKFVNISFVGSDALAKDLQGDGNGVIVSQVVPLPTDPVGSTLVKNYQAALKSQAPDEPFGFVSLEGYMAGRLAGEVLSHMDGDVTRESFLDKLYGMGTITIDDFTLTYGPQDNQGSDRVFLTVIGSDNNFVSVTKLDR